MMKKQFVSLLGALTALLVLLGSCTSPLTTLSQGSTTPAALGAKDVRLVFNTSSPSSDRSAAGAGFLTVQLESVADGTVKFASASLGDPTPGVFTVTVGGMIGGEWRLRVRFWNDDVNKVLMFYANTKETIVPGQAKTVHLTVFPVGSIGGIDVVDAKMPDHVTLLGQDDQVSVATVKLLSVGSTWALYGIAYSSLDNSTPASNPAVSWSSSDEKVAVVSASGNATILGLGEAIITATSIIDPSKSAIYRLEGVSPLFGSWKNTYNEHAYNPLTGNDELVAWLSEVYRFTNTAFTHYIWSSEGDAQAIRGSYTLSGGLLVMKPTDELDATLATPGWKPLLGGRMTDLVATINAPGDVLVIAPVFAGAMGSLLSAVPEDEAMGFSMVYYRSAEVPLSSVTVNGSALGFKVRQGVAVNRLGVETGPADATIGGVVWKSSDATKFGPLYGAGSTFGGLAMGDDIVVEAFALDGNYSTPLSTFSVDVVADAPPVVTMSSSAYTKTLGAPAFNFTVTNMFGPSNVSWLVKELNSGSWNTVGSGSSSSVWGTNLSFSISSYLVSLSDGHYQFQIRAVDQPSRENNPELQAFDFWVDTTAPATAATNFDDSLPVALIQTGVSNDLMITFDDGVSGSGVSDSSFLVKDSVTTTAIANLTLFNSLSAANETISQTVTFSQVGDVGYIVLDLVPWSAATYVSGTGTIDLQIADNAGNERTETVTFNVGS